MQGIRTDVTNEPGDYRFPAVAAGHLPHRLRAGRLRHRHREGVRRRPRLHRHGQHRAGRGQPRRRPVTVTGAVAGGRRHRRRRPPTNFGEEKLAALPNARDFWTVLAASPAMVLTRIDVGGSAAGTQTGYAVYDTKQDQHRPMVEGHRQHRRHRRLGLLLRLRLDRRSGHRDQGPHGRDAVAGRVVELHRQVRRQRVPRQDLRRLPEQGHPARATSTTASRSCARAATAATCSRPT